MAAPDYLAQADALGDITGVRTGPESHASFATAPKPAAKAPGFASQVGHSLINIPKAVGGALVHGVVDPFAHLITNAGNALNAGKHAQTAEDASKALNALSTKAKADFQAGHITRAQYIAQTHKITQQASALAQDQHSNAVKGFGQMLPDAAQAIFTAATLGAGGIEAGGARALAEAAGAKVAGKAGAAVAGKAVQAGADLVGAGKGNVLTKTVRNAALVQPTVQLGAKTVGDVAHGNLKGIAGDAALLAVPKTLNLVGKATEAVGPMIRDALMGKSATLTDAFGVNRVVDYLNKGGDANALKRMELFTENQPAVKSGRPAGEWLHDYLLSKGVDGKAAPMDDVVKQFNNYAEAHGALHEAYKSNRATIGDALSRNKQATAEAKATNNMPTSSPSKKLNYAQAQAFEKAFGTKPPAEMLRGHKAPKLITPKLDKVPTAMPKDLVVTADFRKAIPEAVKSLQALGDSPTAQEKIAAINKALDSLGNTNETIRTQIAAALTEKGTGSEMAAALKPIVQKQIFEHPDIKLPGGFVATSGPKDVAKLPSAAEAAKAGDVKIGSEGKGVFGAVGRTADKLGIGLRTTPSRTTQGAIASSLDKRLTGSPYEGRAKEIMTALHNETSKTSGVYDPRMLRAVNNGVGPARASVENALRSISSASTPQDAKMILKAVKGAYGDVPLGIRSLGEKATDKLIQHISPMATYLKAQGYGKFSANPFFWVKQATKGEFIGQAETGGKALNLGRAMNQMLGSAPSRDTSNLLERSGLTSKANVAGTEADALGTEAFGLHGSTAQVNEYIKQSMGQAAEQFAKNNKTTVKELLDAEHPQHQEFNHLMEMIVGYPKGANYLNTNLAKTLNVLVFPSRFEAKVGIAAAKYFLAQPKVVQLAMTNSLLRANAWSSSPEGKQFQKDNADLIGALNYFSPTHTLGALVDFGKGGGVQSIGQIGGLPLGVITTILTHQGVKVPQLNDAEDLNPATGQPYTSKIPTTSKARLQQGIQDLLGSMFAYPGATVGLPSKTGVVGGVPGLKINAKNQKVVGTTPSIPTAAPASSASNPTRPITAGTPKVVPIYKGSAAKAPKAKVHAVKPANSRL